MRLTLTDEAILCMRERSMTVADVEAVIATGEVIRDYADDRPFASRLVLAIVDGRPLHVVYADDVRESDGLSSRRISPIRRCGTVNSGKGETMSGNCLFCRVGNREPGVTSITLTRDDTAVIVHGVPAEVCDACGHAYFDTEAARALEQMHEATLAAGAKYAVREYASKVA